MTLTKDQVLVLLEEARSQALNFKNPHVYIYPVLLSIIQDLYHLNKTDMKALYELSNNHPLELL